MKEKALEKDKELLECEKLWIFAVMIAVGGFLGAYTYVQKGGVFCNAQTANFVLMAVQLGQGNWRKALYYLLPASAYLLGTIISEFLPKHINRRKIVRWDTAFVAFEMVWIFALGFVPDSAPPQICQVAVNFIASMQFNTFRQAKRYPWQRPSAPTMSVRSARILSSGFEAGIKRRGARCSPIF